MAEGGRTSPHTAAKLAGNYFGFMYQKIANATRATVMIHRTMSLLRFFSSAIRTSTAHLKSRFKCRVESPQNALVMVLSPVRRSACSQ